MDQIGHTTQLYQWLNDLGSGRTAAQEEVIGHTCERLRFLTRRMLRGYPKVRRWSETDDVLQNAMMRLHRALVQVKPETPQQYYGLAATQIRRELIDLARHFYGVEGLGANHKTDEGQAASQQQDHSAEPQTLEKWSEFHQKVEQLPQEQQDVVNLLWYEGISQPEAAHVLGVSLATVKRRWQAARLQLCEQLQGSWGAE